MILAIAVNYNGFMLKYWSDNNNRDMTMGWYQSLLDHMEIHYNMPVSKNGREIKIC